MGGRLYGSGCLPQGVHQDRGPDSCGLSQTFPNAPLTNGAFRLSIIVREAVRLVTSIFLPVPSAKGTVGNPPLVRLQNALEMAA